MYLNKQDLFTHIYGENINVITRNTSMNDGIVNEAIKRAVSLVQSYMGRYNIPLLLPTPGTPDWETLPDGFIDDPALKGIVKDIACWYLIKLANPNVHIELFRAAYEDAIVWLKDLQKGVVAPPGWAYRIDDPNTDYVEGGKIQWNSNNKRNNHF
jgi:phage gp36-like protein